MAGAGYKLFNTGDVLTAAQVNTYLQEQAVMRFANATARTTALSGVLAEGMMSYLDDTNSVEVYNGSAWVSVGSTGDITEVTTAANSGLTGGATSGAVALRVNTTAKGSIIAGTGATTLGELTVGANNTVLTADSSTATGLKWATTTAPSFSGVHLTMSANTTISNATETILGFNTETFDTDGFHDNVTNNSRITIPTGRGGKYLIYALVRFAPNATGDRYMFLVKNSTGGIIVGGAYAGGFTSSVSNTTMIMSRVVDAAAGDWFAVGCYQSSGGNLNALGDAYNTYFGMYYLGA